MLIETRALILRAIKYGDSSLILETYTEAKGIRKYIVGGVRKARSRTPASLVQPMNLVDLIAYEREGKDMTRLKEVRPAHIYTRLPFDVYRGTVGLFMLEVTRNAIREAEENPAMFSFLYEAFRLLDTTEGPITHFHLHFLLEFTAHLGMLPAGNWTEATQLFDLKEGSFITDHPGHPEYLDEEQANLMYALLHARHDELGRITSSRQQRNQLLVELIRYYRYHIEGMREINSLKVLREVMG